MPNVHPLRPLYAEAEATAAPCAQVGELSRIRRHVTGSMTTCLRATGKSWKADAGKKGASRAGQQRKTRWPGEDR